MHNIGMILSRAALALSMVSAAALPAAAGPESKPSAVEPRDGQRDFDYELGRWKMKLRKLKKPLSGTTEWIEFAGTSVVRPLWDGKSQVEEFSVDSPTAGRILGMTLRLYNPTTRQWRIYWANQKNGQFDLPVVGEFKDGRGEFYDQEPYEGRMIFVRYVWSNMTATSAHFEQSFSTDGGKTWEVNWITDQTRVE